MSMIMNRALRLGLIAGPVLVLSGCDQPVATPAQPRPDAVVPDARYGDRASQETRLREILRLLVEESNSLGGRAALRTQQEVAQARLTAALASAPGSAERQTMDQLLARLRALSSTSPTAIVHAPGSVDAQTPPGGSR